MTAGIWGLEARDWIARVALAEAGARAQRRGRRPIAHFSYCAGAAGKCRRPKPGPFTPETNCAIVAQLKLANFCFFVFRWGERLTIALSAIRTFFLGRRYSAIGFATAIAVAFSVPALARSHGTALVRTHSNNDNLSPAERYAWGQIKQGLPANFTEKCDYTWLDPKQGDDPAWRDDDKCRTLSAAFIVDVLTRPSFRDATTFKGVEIRGAKIIGGVDLAFAKIDRPV
jgi:hypothetical protein